MIVKRFELIKFFKNKKNILIIISIFIGICLYFPFQKASFEKKREDLYQADYKIYLDLYQQLTSFSRNDEDREEINQTMESLDSYWGYSKTDNWKQALREENNYLEGLIKLEKKNYIDFNLGFNKEDKIKKNNVLLTQKNRPMNEVFGLSGIYYMMLIFVILTGSVGMFVLITFSFDYFAKEYEDETINFLYVQPQNRKNFFKIKQQIVFQTFLGVTILAMIFSYIVGYIFTKKGGNIFSAQFLNDTGSRVLYIWEYLLAIFIVEFFILKLMLEIISFLSMKLKNSQQVFIFFMTFFVMFPFFLSQFINVRTEVVFIPFTHINTFAMSEYMFTHNYSVIYFLILLSYLIIIIIVLNITRLRRNQ